MPVMYLVVVMLLHRVASSRPTCARTQEKNRMPVLYQDVGILVNRAVLLGTIFNGIIGIPVLVEPSQLPLPLKPLPLKPLPLKPPPLPLHNPFK